MNRFQEGLQIEEEVREYLEKLGVKWIWRRSYSRAPDFAIMHSGVFLPIEVTSDSSSSMNFFIAKWKYLFLSEYPLVVVYKKKAQGIFYTFLLLNQGEVQKTAYLDKYTKEPYYQIRNPAIFQKGLPSLEDLQIFAKRIGERH